ncbi:hypothetical protein BC829DRAFT_414711 [Chytridium lagenaria]|nr:hypothetical protein BC829DRAFT_414711 [Chytridium lagenaria]
MLVDHDVATSAFLDTPWTWSDPDHVLDAITDSKKFMATLASTTTTPHPLRTAATTASEAFRIPITELLQPRPSFFVDELPPYLDDGRGESRREVTPVLEDEFLDFGDEMKGREGGSVGREAEPLPPYMGDVRRREATLFGNGGLMVNSVPGLAFTGFGQSHGVTAFSPNTTSAFSPNTTNAFNNTTTAFSPNASTAFNPNSTTFLQPAAPTASSHPNTTTFPHPTPTAFNTPTPTSHPNTATTSTVPVSATRGHASTSRKDVPPPYIASGRGGTSGGAGREEDGDWVMEG